MSWRARAITSVTSVDSEVLSHLIEHELRRGGDLFDAVQTALTRVQGSWAIAVLEQGSGRIVVSAQDSPLLVARSHHGDFAASDIAAIADWTDEFRVLDDSDVVDLTDGGRWVRGVIDSTPLAVGRCSWRGRDADLNGYSDFMAKEIDEQPFAASRVIDTLAGSVVSGALWSDTGLGVVRPAASDRLRHVAERGARDRQPWSAASAAIPVTFTIASEAAEETPDARQLCLAISQSGETADVLHAAETDAVTGAPLLAITNNPHSTLARRADAVLSCDAGPEIGVAATKTFVCQIIAGAALMISALVATGRCRPRMLRD